MKPLHVFSVKLIIQGFPSADYLFSLDYEGGVYPVRTRRIAAAGSLVQKKKIEKRKDLKRIIIGWM